jgi:hypothetical protein
MPLLPELAAFYVIGYYKGWAPNGADHGVARLKNAGANRIRPQVRVAICAYQTQSLLLTLCKSFCRAKPLGLASPKTLSRRNAPIITADLGNLCSDLERFKLPAAVGDLTTDAFAFWNASFCEKMSLTAEELTQVKFSGLIRFDEKYADLTTEKAQPNCRVGALPCAIKRSANDEIIPACAIKNENGLLLLLVDSPAHDPKFEGYIQGRIVGREEEANRMRKFFHDLLSSKILVASFLAHSVHDKLARRQAPEIEDLQKVTTLLDAVIDAIVHGFEHSP